MVWGNVGVDIILLIPVGVSYTAAAQSIAS